MKRIGGFTPPGKQMVLKRIQEIRKKWSSDSSMPIKLKIPYTGKKIQSEPTPKDQLKAASMNTLKTLQFKLNRQDSDEDWFYKIFQKHEIDFLEEKLKSRGRRSSRKK